MSVFIRELVEFYYYYYFVDASGSLVRLVLASASTQKNREFPAVYKWELLAGARIARQLTVR